MARAFDIGMAIVVVAGIFVMVRPGSQGPRLIGYSLNGFTQAIKSATGGGSW